VVVALLFRSHLTKRRYLSITLLCRCLQLSGRQREPERAERRESEKRRERVEKRESRRKRKGRETFFSLIQTFVSFLLLFITCSLVNSTPKSRLKVDDSLERKGTFQPYQRQDK
jgi:hypothetical protein